MEKKRYEWLKGKKMHNSNLYQRLIKNKTIWFWFVIGCAILLRFPYLGIIPPANSNMISFRLLTAGAGVSSIALLIKLVQLLTRDSRLGLISGLVYSFMPWHLEQSRVYSPVLLGLTVVLIGLNGYLFLSNKFLKISLFVVIIAAFNIIYPIFSIIEISFMTLTPNYILYNFFKLVSYNFLFNLNDSFWWGGLRTIGVFLPSTVFVFILGLIVILKKITVKYWFIIITGGFILLIAILNPKFPEGREYFLISPYYAVIVGLGVIKLLEHFKNSNILIKTLISVYILFCFYDYILFYHQYTVHYSRRIESEMQINDRSF